MKLKELIQCFDKAMKEGARYIGVSICVPDAEENEVIINSSKNFDVKLDYYKKTYDKDLRHNAVGDTLKITNAVYGDTFSAIQNKLKGG
ncbi:hypothetical protein [Oceanobacillus oncorhynchi]|uniref:hypothetical protein n=1 Tax=Oceanobacillus oncorhynchi TaxID=545501 RepID=UPI0034D567A8